jgi:hypothetical protein
MFCYQKVVFCTFGKIKKHEMESGFDIKNHGLRIDLKGPFPKGTKSQKSKFATILPNSPYA